MIATIPIKTDDGEDEARLFERSPCGSLAVTYHNEEFRVTHVSSGMSLGQFPDRFSSVGALEDFAKLFDWPTVAGGIEQIESRVDRRRILAEWIPDLEAIRSKYGGQ